MDIHNPALVTALFFAAGDRGGDRVWEIVTAGPAADLTGVRWRRVLVDGATIVQVGLARSGAWPATVWQEMTAQLADWLGWVVEEPPRHLWGGSRLYLGAVVTGLYEERRLVEEGLTVAEESIRRVVQLPVGRLWLVSPPAVSERGALLASYAWFHAPGPEIRRQVDRLLWEENAPFLRSELYLHRALHQLRQYGREERAAFWAALEQLEMVVPAVLAHPEDARSRGRLGEATRIVVRGMARLSRLHNLLRSSAHLYRQIGSELCQEGGGLFSWYEERQKEAIVQWGYDLDRADRAIALARTALVALPEPPPPRPAPAVPPWFYSLVGAAVLALSLVDRSWIVVAARLGVTLLLLLALWLFSRRRSRSMSE